MSAPQITFRLFAIFVLKIIRVDGNMTKLCQK